MEFKYFGSESIEQELQFYYLTSFFCKLLANIVPTARTHSTQLSYEVLIFLVDEYHRCFVLCWINDKIYCLMLELMSVPSTSVLPLCCSCIPYPGYNAS